ncbi:hypothetical protein ACRYCC_01710 [Actinomadura scrupuli]|uniref:hypothetical protein n=1 Tax=Actinomadura scrupuli TaxID=559629 RepID=UPI003D990290
MTTVHDLMSRALELPYGEARTVLMEDALRRAEADRDESLAFGVRMELSSAYQYGGEPAKTFTTFSRCLADFDRDPGRFDAGAEHRLLWHFKWIISSLTKFPEVPLDRTYAVLDDMERRYRLGGHSLHAVYARRAWVAQHLGDTEAADHWYTRWHAAPRDELSDCMGCDPSAKVRYLTWRGRDEDALTIAQPLLREEFSCTEQPQDILTELLPVHLRTGRLDEARDAHRRAYRLLRTHLSDMALIGDHLLFCGQSGNEVRGLEILERHLGWLDRAPTPSAAMWFSAGGALVLRRLTEAGHDAVVVRRPAHGDRPAGTVTARELLTELTERALELAARFDLRNGTAEQTRLVRTVLDAPLLTDHLPLTPHARRPAQGPVPLTGQPLAGEPAAVLSAAVRSEGEVPVTPDGWLDAAEEAWHRRDSSAALAAWRRFDQLTGPGSAPDAGGPAGPEAGLDEGRDAGPEAGPALLRAGRRADGHGLERALDGDLEGAEREWRRAAGLYARAGDEERRQATLSRIGSLLCQSGREDEGLQVLETAQAYLRANAVRRRRALAARLRLAAAYTATGRGAEALTSLDEAVAELTTGEAGTPGGDAEDLRADLADVDLERARTLLRIGGREEPAAEALRQACDGYRGTDRPGPLAEAALTLAQVLAGTSDPSDEAAQKLIGELCTEAVVHTPAEIPGLRAAAYAHRGGWLLSRGEDGQAAEDLIEAVALFTALGAHPQAAYARRDLCVAYFNTGRHLEAAEVAEEAVPMLTELGDPEAARRCRFLLAHAQRELGEREQAAETFTLLAGEEETAAPGIAAEFLRSAGDLLSELDKDALAAERFDAAARAHAAADEPYGVVQARRRQAMCLSWAGRAEEGLRVMELARDGLAELPADNAPALTWETALVSYDEARLLGALGRWRQAITRADEAIAGFETLDEADAAGAARDLRTDLQQRT